MLMYSVSEIIENKEWEERGWLIGEEGGHYIENTLVLKDCAHLTLFDFSSLWEP